MHVQSHAVMGFSRWDKVLMGVAVFVLAVIGALMAYSVTNA